MRVLILVFLSLLFIGIHSFAQGNGHSAVAEAGLYDEGIDRYEDFLKREIEAGRIAGAVSFISRKGALAHHKAFGYNNIETKSAMTEDKIFYIQSMTKPIVSIAFMSLYEEGHFFLDDPVAKYLPEFADLKVMQVTPTDGEPEVSYVPLDEPVRIWHLLSHTAGFSHGLGDNDYDKELTRRLYETEHASIRDRVKALSSYPLMGQPGKQWNYSASPDVLALLIEHFSGISAAEFLQKNIFDPLGMKDTGYNVPKNKQGRVVGLHEMQEDGTLKPIDQWSPLEGVSVYGGTHGLWSTAQDYINFGLMLLNNGEFNGKRILGRKTLELMTDNHIDGLPYSPGNGFGLGFGVLTDVSDNKMSGSEGTFYWGGLFNTYFFVDKEEDMVTVLMTQSFPHNGFYADKMRQFVYSAIAD